MAHIKHPRFLDNESLQKKLIYWQDRLALGQWSITVEVLPLKNMNGANGTNHYNTANLTSRILLIDPADFDDQNEHEVYDMEFVLVHELLHLLVEVHRHSSTYDEREEIDLEMAVNSLARSFIAYENEREVLLYASSNPRNVDHEDQAGTL